MALAPPIRFDRGPFPRGCRPLPEGHQALVLLAQALDRQPHAVAGFEELRWLHAETDTRRRAGRDNVARQQGHEMADIADDLIDPEDNGASLSWAMSVASTLAPSAAKASPPRGRSPGRPPSPGHVYLRAVPASGQIATSGASL